MPRLLPLLTVLAAFAVAGPAHASVAYMNENGVPTAEGEPGEANDITAAGGEDGVVLTDAAGIRPRDEGGFCRALSPTAVTCLGESAALLLGRDGDDTLRDVGLAAGFGARGGPGNDTIVAGSVAAFLYGDDRTVLPTDGDDRITGSSAEVKPGGPENDFADLLEGGGGNDTIDAGAGADQASGQAGDDTIDGGDGNDLIDTSSLLTADEQDAPGDAGDDTLRGSSGNDQINAERGRDSADGGGGDDFLRGIDVFTGDDDGASDTFVCGDGADRVTPGQKDRVAYGCETVRILFFCNGYPCKATGTMSGKPKGAKKATVVAKGSKSLTSPDYVDFALGAKAAKLLGTAKKLGLTAEITGRRGKAAVGYRRTVFTLVP